MKKLLIATLFIVGSLSCQQRCDETTTFEQAIANAKKTKQLTFLGGLRLKGDDTTPQDQWDALVDRIALVLTEPNLQAAIANCPFFVELDSIPGLSGSFFIQASDGSCDEEVSGDSIQQEAAQEEVLPPSEEQIIADQTSTEVEIAAPCDCGIEIAA